MARPRLAAALVFLGAALLSGVTALDGIQPNDEGLMLQAAARIADGQVPYSDFWWFYPPGQPYLLAGLWELFGPSLVPWRALRVLCDAGVAVLVWLLALRGGASARMALAAALVAALAMAYPSGPHPFPPTLLMALGALLLLERRPALAGALAGLAAVWRIEFAAYLWLGAMLAYALRPADVDAPAASAAEARAAHAQAADAPAAEARAAHAQAAEAQAAHAQAARLRPALAFTAAAAAVAATLYLPVVAAAGLDHSFELLVRYPIEDFSDYQSLPFPLDYDGPLNTGSVGGFLSDSAENLLVFYLPLVLMIGLAGSLIALGVRFDRSRWWQAAAGVFAIGMAHYLVTRPDIFHTAPLTVMVAVLAGWTASGGRAGRAAVLTGRTASGGRAGRVVALVGAGLAVLALAYSLVEGLDRRWLELRTDFAELRLQPADGVRVRADRRASLERAVREVRSRVPAGEPIYVATRRSDLVTSGDPLFYVLTERPNPTRYDIQAPGVITSAPVQHEIVTDLRRVRPRVVVRFTAVVTAAPEPNRAGESTGVTVLDDYLQRAYRPAARHGVYEILTRR